MISGDSAALTSPPPSDLETPRRHPHRWRNLSIIGLAVVAVLGIGGYIAWDRIFSNPETPVDVAAVEDRFSGGDTSAKAGTPKPGVYLYRTKGSESVSALGGATVDYPDTTTLTVTTTDCGVDTRWDVLEGRYDEAKLCRRANGTWILTGTVTSDRFFNQTEADTYTCPDIVDLPANPKVGQRWRGTCTDTPNTTTLRYEVIGTETVRVDGKPVDTIHLRVRSTQGGQRGGSGTEHRWVQPGTNLVVKATNTERDTSPSPIGEVTYKQNYEIILESLEPKS